MIRIVIVDDHAILETGQVDPGAEIDARADVAHRAVGEREIHHVARVSRAEEPVLAAITSSLLRVGIGGVFAVWRAKA